jgi:hypothetical protein
MTSVGDKYLKKPRRAQKALIVGACCSYDVSEVLLPADKQRRYWWRNNTISMMSAERGDSTLLSACNLQPDELNTVRRDLEKNFPFEDDFQWADVVLVDFFRDTYDILKLTGGSYVTRGPEFERYPLQSILPVEEHIKFGTPKYLDLWLSAIQHFTFRVSKQDTQIILVNPFMSPVQEEKGKFKVSEALNHYEVIRKNFFFYHMSRIVVGLIPGIISLHFKPWSIGSWKEHPWGEAPIHYARQRYEDMLETLDTDIADAELRSNLVPLRELAKKRGEISVNALKRYVDSNL